MKRYLLGLVLLVGLVELNAQKGCSWAEFDSCVMGINNVLEKIEMFGKDPCSVAQSQTERLATCRWSHVDGCAGDEKEQLLASYTNTLNKISQAEGMHCHNGHEHGHKENPDHSGFEMTTVVPESKNHHGPEKTDKKCHPDEFTRCMQEIRGKLDHMERGPNGQVCHSLKDLTKQYRGCNKRDFDDCKEGMPVDSFGFGRTYWDLRSDADGVLSLMSARETEACSGDGFRYSYSAGVVSAFGQEQLLVFFITLFLCSVFVL